MGRWGRDGSRTRRGRLGGKLWWCWTLGAPIFVFDWVRIGGGCLGARGVRHGMRTLLRCDPSQAKLAKDQVAEARQTMLWTRLPYGQASPSHRIEDKGSSMWRSGDMWPEQDLRKV